MQQARSYMLGERAVVLELDPPVQLNSQQRIWGLCQKLARHPQVQELIPGMNNLTVLLNASPASAQAATEQLQRWWEESEEQTLEPRLITIPVCYGGACGPDLPEVARLHQMSERQVVELHSSAEYSVFFIGFQPGFPYLAGLNEKLHTPRRAEPRVQVPAGSVGIGGSQTGDLSAGVTGGWQLIGHSDHLLFDPRQQPPALLQPGDQVRFVPQKEGVC